ncbi:MAG: flagellar filament capping protein FliD [Deltaproteobacteria bacterium]|nr:flagellar filament capping protein FliD [Deltaproteobacteria bacterium]
MATSSISGNISDTGTVHLGGLASGIDTEGIITGLVSASSSVLAAQQNRASLMRAAVSTLSSIGSGLSSLQSALSALSTVDGATGLKATTSSSAVTANAGAGAMCGALSMTVTSVAAEQRTYSSRFDSATQALGQAGSFTIAVGTGNTTIQVTAADSLTSIAAKINAAGVKVTAAVFQDGTKSRLLIRGVDTGSANKVTLTESGTTLDLNGDGSTPDGGKTVAATDAVLNLDGFTVTRSTNTISDLVKGVTLTINAKSADPVTVTVGAEASVLQLKIASVLTAYNSTIQAVHTAAGYGTVAASNSLLAGNSGLRTVTSRMASILGTPSGSGTYQMLSQIGITLNRDGTLKLDSTKLTAALATDPTGAATLLSGRMAALQTAVAALSTGDTSPIVNQQNNWTSQAKKLDDWCTSEQARLENYATMLRKSFSAMETSVSQSQALILQLSKITG